MIDKNEFNFRNRFAGVITTCIWLCVILLELFFRVEIIKTSPESPTNLVWFFWITFALLWMIAPYFRNYFDDFKSSGYTPLIEKNELYFRSLFAIIVGACILLCVLVLDKLTGTSFIEWIFDNVWAFWMALVSSWIVAPYFRNCFNVFQDSDK